MLHDTHEQKAGLSGCDVFVAYAHAFKYITTALKYAYTLAILDGEQASSWSASCVDRSSRSRSWAW